MKKQQPAPRKPLFHGLRIMFSSLRWFPLCNLNRDRDGRPKMADYGFVPRIVVSPACQKRLIAEALLDACPDDPAVVAFRTRALPAILDGSCPVKSTLLSRAQLEEMGFSPLEVQVLPTLASLMTTKQAKYYAAGDDEDDEGQDAPRSHLLFLAPDDPLRIVQAVKAVKDADPALAANLLNVEMAVAATAQEILDEYLAADIPDARDRRKLKASVEKIALFAPGILDRLKAARKYPKGQPSVRDLGEAVAAHAREHLREPEPFLGDLDKTKAAKAQPPSARAKEAFRRHFMSSLPKGVPAYIALLGRFTTGDFYPNVEGALCWAFAFGVDPARPVTDFYVAKDDLLGGTAHLSKDDTNRFVSSFTLFQTGVLDLQSLAENMGPLYRPGIAAHVVAAVLSFLYSGQYVSRRNHSDQFGTAEIVLVEAFPDHALAVSHARAFEAAVRPTQECQSIADAAVQRLLDHVVGPPARPHAGTQAEASPDTSRFVLATRQADSPALARLKNGTVHHNLRAACDAVAAFLAAKEKEAGL